MKTKFFKAVRSCDSNAISEFLAKGISVNTVSDDYETALMAAVKRGYFELCEFLIAHGAALNIRNYEDETALMCAIDAGHTEIAELLVRHGADINARTYRGETLLMRAAELGRTEIVRISRRSLLKKLQSLRKRNKYKNTSTSSPTSTFLSPRISAVGSNIRPC